jgi:hypothetical protein
MQWSRWRTTSAVSWSTSRRESVLGFLGCALCSPLPNPGEWPPRLWVNLPSLRADMAPVRVLGYPIVTVLAEKLKTGEPPLYDVQREELLSTAAFSARTILEIQVCATCS